MWNPGLSSGYVPSPVIETCSATGVGVGTDELQARWPRCENGLGFSFGFFFSCRNLFAILSEDKSMGAINPVRHAVCVSGLVG